LPMRELDKVSLQHKLDQIGRDMVRMSDPQEGRMA
jgi:hypothetical protein